MSLPSPRQSTGWIDSEPLSRVRDVKIWAESLASDHVWDELRLYSNVWEVGRSIFHVSTAEQKRRWRALNDYARQAQAYYEALEKTVGTARGLLSYYSALNLAKAELLHSSPDRVIDAKIHHGLSFDIGSNTSVRADRVKVLGNGVFPLLYAARTGEQIAANTMVPVRRLLGRVPEIGHEQSRLFPADRGSTPGWYVVATNRDTSECWPVLAFIEADMVTGSAEWVELRRHFQQVDISPTWRSDLPGLKIDSRPTLVLESKSTFSWSPNNMHLAVTDSMDLVRRSLGSALDDTNDAYCQFVFSPSLWKTRHLSMTAFLARYVLMFYLSSLIRYRPSRLNPDREQLTVWLLEAFARQAPVRLLANGLEGVKQSAEVFGAR